jgi:hypothetical protein
LPMDIHRYRIWPWPTQLNFNASSENPVGDSFI